MADGQLSEQEALSVVLAAHIAHTWPLLDPARMKATFDRWMAVVAALVFNYGKSSASLAARSYSARRVAAGLPRMSVPLADGPPVEQVRKSLEWATHGLWSPSPDVQAAQALIDGAMQRLVADQGRNTMIQAIESDRRCRGWARVARPGACSFCAMLSTRGAVYKSKETASITSGEQGNRPAGLTYHDNCHCVPVPLFANFYEPPAHVRDWQRMWRESTAGKHGNEARIAFRQAVEGRTPSDQQG